tara:strand:+ start:241 stop:342 length:102 start_codon:yes stop_codon:yes gene_type:complete
VRGKGELEEEESCRRCRGEDERWRGRGRGMKRQ